jgi:membrane protease YdiL (CAAX protease family)
MQSETKLHGSGLTVAVIVCFLVGTMVVVAGYHPKIAFDIRMWMRAGLCIISLAGLLLFKRGQPAWEKSLAFLAISAGLLAAGLLRGLGLEWLHISASTAQGFAIDKINETLPIILIILLLVWWSRRDLHGLYLRRGRLGLSLLGGIAIGVLLFAYFLSQGGWQVFQNGNLKALLPTIGWVTIFSIFNGFMEELWFRGLFLSRFEWLIGRRWAFWVTSLVFGLLHALGNFGGTLGSALLTFFTLLLGMAFGYIVQKTGSIWGAVLGHFFADFFFILGYFATIG